MRPPEAAAPAARRGRGRRAGVEGEPEPTGERFLDCELAFFRIHSASYIFLFVFFSNLLIHIQVGKQERYVPLAVNISLNKSYVCKYYFYSTTLTTGARGRGGRSGIVSFLIIFIASRLHFICCSFFSIPVSTSF